MTSPADKPAGSGTRVLLVEDESAIRRAASATLEAAGYAVETAADIESAEKALDRTDYDLALIDLHLRDGQGGFLLVRRIGASDASTVVIVVSSTKDFEDVLAAFRLGAADFVPKPLRTGELITVVRRALRAAQAPANEAEELDEVESTGSEPADSTAEAGAA